MHITDLRLATSDNGVDRDEQRDVYQTADCSTKQEQNDSKICL